MSHIHSFTDEINEAKLNIFHCMTDVFETNSCDLDFFVPEVVTRIRVVFLSDLESGFTSKSTLQNTNCYYKLCSSWYFTQTLAMLLRQLFIE